MTLRTVYYREPSTRVVQPVVEIEKDLPDGFDVNTHVLLDAITSASAASGPAGDNIFTEVRDEAGLRIGKNWSRARVTLAYNYSAESDYWSHIFAAGAAFRVWGDTGTLSLSAGAGFDQVGKRVLGLAPTPAVNPGDPCVPNGTRHCALDQRFAGINYTQVLTPTVVAQVGYELALLDGFLSSPYRTVPQKGALENVPDKRWRNALAARVAWYLPEKGLGFQLHYRYYRDFYFQYKLGFIPTFATDPQATGGTDPWNISSHTIEGRVFKTLGRDVEVRATYRFYTQGAAGLWCDPASALMMGTSCYSSSSTTLYTSDPKLTPVRTQYLEGKIYWDATRWRGTPFAGWFAAGTFEFSYGYYWQNTTYVGAHVLQAGYTIPY
ncbi:MAG TPA: DUF3570 domain-containing protein [Polyangia bacterium]